MHKNLLILIISSLLITACTSAVQNPAIAENNVPENSDEIPSPAESSSAEDTLPAGAENEFTTDFSKHTIPYSEVLSGGPPKDGIPSIDAPNYEAITDADEWLEDIEAVVVIAIEGTARAYPVQILMWHEIVNDVLGNNPISITFCPLCNTAIAFDRNFDGQVLDFGTTGRLRYSNLIMYDRQTETWWQQATGEGIAGEYSGETLSTIPAFLISWAAFKEEYPQGDVLSRETGFTRTYGSNPYNQYDNENSAPFLYIGPSTPSALPQLSRVLTIDDEQETVAYPYTTLEKEKVINDSVAGKEVVIFWQPGTASALDESSVAGGRDVGSATSFSRVLENNILTFEAFEDGFRDIETGTTWNHLGLGIDGELAGRTLNPIVSINHFWFSWAAFRPDTRVYGIEKIETGNEDNIQNQFNTPNLQLQDDFSISLYQGQDIFNGEDITLSRLLSNGKPLVVGFYAGLCPICRGDLPVLDNAYQTYGEDINIIAVDIGPFLNLGSVEDGIQMLNDLGVGLPAGVLQDANAIVDYRILGTPSFLFFRSNGELSRTWVGSIKEDQMAFYIEEIL